MSAFEIWISPKGKDTIDIFEELANCYKDTSLARATARFFAGFHITAASTGHASKGLLLMLLRDLRHVTVQAGGIFEEAEHEGHTQLHVVLPADESATIQ